MYLTIHDTEKSKINSQSDSHFDNYDPNYYLLKSFHCHQLFLKKKKSGFLHATKK